MLSLVRGLRDFVRGPAPVHDPAPAARVEDRVREVIRAEFRPGAKGPPRLNLLIPTVDGRRAYAGVRSAIELFEALGAFAPRTRIVSMTALPTTIPTSLARYRREAPGTTAGVSGTHDGRSDAELVGLGDTPDHDLEIGPDDVFLATFWTTAELARRMLDWQDATFGRQSRVFGYVIQDFEPGFYPWSAQWLLARETYADPARTVAFFNSAMLQAYFHGEGLHFAHEFVFEPRLLPGLVQAGSRRDASDESIASPERARTIVVYGRPSTPRNAFPLVVDGLRAWVQADAQAPRWTLISVGEAHAPVDLGHGIFLVSRGKLALDEYAQLLRSSSIGISLMVSPHPSLPPLEMAALGLRVITNRFADKDLATVHPNIQSLGRNTADGFAAALAALCDRIDADRTLGDRGRQVVPGVLADEPPYGFAGNAARIMGIARAVP